MPDVNILINAVDRASGPLKTVGGAVDNLAGKATGAARGGLASLGNALGTALKVGAFAGIGALGALATAVVGTGVNFDNMKQQADIAFTTMLGSGEKAKVFLDDLQQFAAATPFEFPDLLQASQRLLAMGFAAEDVKPTLTAVGDAVAALGGSGELVGRVTTALGQMQAKGKASAEEMGQLTEAGIPGWKFLAEAIGTDVAGAMDQVSKGAIDADTVISAVVAGMNEDFGGMMAKQSQTWGGLVSTLKDTFTQLSGTVMGPLFERMSGWLSGIVTWISRPEFAAWAENFGQGIADVVGAFEFLFTHFGDWTTQWEDGSTVFSSFLQRLGVAEPTANAIGLAFSNLARTMAMAWETIKGVFDLIVQGIGQVREGWDEDWGGIRSTWEKFQVDTPRQHEEFWAQWHKTFGENSGTNELNWQAFFARLEAAMIAWNASALKLQEQNNLQWITFLQGIEGEIKLWTGVFSGNWQVAWDALKSITNTATNFILNDIQFVFGPGLRNSIVLILTAVTDFFAGWALDLQSDWTTFWGGLATLPDLSSAGREFMSNMWKGVTGYWSSTVEPWWREKTQWLADMLPGSEPKDPSSPLRDLAHRGEALMRNFASGMETGAPFMQTRFTGGLAGIAPVAAAAAPASMPSYNITVNLAQGGYEEGAAAAEGILDVFHFRGMGI